MTSGVSKDGVCGCLQGTKQGRQGNLQEGTFKYRLGSWWSWCKGPVAGGCLTQPRNNGQLEVWRDLVADLGQPRQWDLRPTLTLGSNGDFGSFKLRL